MKTGIIFEGGAKKAIFSAGVADVLLDAGIEFDYVGAISSGSHCALNFVSKQKGRAFDVLSSGLYRKGNNSYYRKVPFFLRKLKRGMDFLNYDSAYREDNKFDFDTFFSSKTECEIGVTRVEGAVPEFKSERSDGKRLFDYVGTSCNLPIMFPFAELDGAYYVDGSITNSIPFDRAFEKGCDKVIVVSTKVKGDKAVDYSKYDFFSKRMYAKKYPELYEALTNRYDNYMIRWGKMELLQEQGKVLILRPEIELCKTFELRYEIFEGVYAHGLDYGKRSLERIKNFLEK